jgi:hypothetical protein
MRGTVDLPLHALVSLMDQHRLGDPHPVLAGGERYVSPLITGERFREVLAAAGLDDRDGRDELLSAIEVVQRAQTEYYGWLTSGEASWSTVAAALGRGGTALRCAGDRVTVRRVDHRRLVETVVRQLPDVPAGTGESISVRASDFGARSTDGVLRRTGRTEEARRLDVLLHTPRLGGGKLYAAWRDKDGHRVRSREWLSVLDLDVGRWVVYPTRGRGERAINAVPATTQLLAAKLTELSRPAR